MERVETLLQKLQQQFKDGVQPAQLLLTVQMLQYELVHLQQNENGSDAMVAVSMPLEVIAAIQQPTPAIPEKPAKEEKIVEVLQVDEAEIEAELEEIKKNAAAMQKISVQSRPQLLFSPSEDDDDIPTLAHQRQNKKPVVIAKEVNETANQEAGSVNDKLKESTTELSEK
jgi:hypothetical protein